MMAAISVIGPAPAPGYAPAPPRFAKPAPPGKPVANDLHKVSVAVNASSPGAPVNESLVGFDGPGPERALGALAKLHPAYIRTDVSFEGSYGGKPVYNCSDGAWNPAPLDSRVQQIRAAGAEPELIVDYMPACLATGTPPGKNPNRSLPDPGAHSAAWSALVKKMATYEIEHEGVRTFEVWNEPDWVFWNDGLQGYEKLYAMTATALEAAAHAARVKIEVGGPALANVLGTMDTNWLDPFLAFVAANHLPLDFLSWHLYANDPDAGPQPGVGHVCIFHADPSTNPCWYNPNLSAGLYAKEAAQAKAALAPYPQLHPRLWIDEWNINGAYDPRQAGPYDGAFVAAVLDAAQRAGISRMCYFFVATGSHGPLGDWGVLNGQTLPVPAYFSFRYWHDLAGRLLEAPVSGGANPFSAGQGGVGAVASRAPGGAVHVLVYDFLPYDPSGNYGTRLPTPTGASVTVRLGHLGRGISSLRVAATSIGGAARLISSSGNVEAAFAHIELPAEGVALVTFAPHRAQQRNLAPWLLALIAVVAAAIVLAGLAIALRSRRAVAAKQPRGL